MTETVVCLENVRFARGGRTIFDDISVEIAAGEITAIMGPSGTGKTTLMRLITGQLQPQQGKITVLGEDIGQLNRKQLMQLRRRISMMFQNNALFTDMTVGENVAFPLKEVLNMDQALIDIIVSLKLQTVGLRGAAHLMPSELSGGMARRAALARAMVMEPELMIYDEPFTGQDPISLAMLTSLVKNLNRGLGMSSLVVSHDLVEVCRIADKILLLSSGKIAAYDTPEHLMASDDPLVAQFFHGYADGPVAFHYPAVDYRQELLGGEDADHR